MVLVEQVTKEMEEKCRAVLDPARREGASSEALIAQAALECGTTYSRAKVAWQRALKSNPSLRSTWEKVKKAFLQDRFCRRRQSKPETELLAEAERCLAESNGELSMAVTLLMARCGVGNTRAYCLMRKAIRAGC